MVFEGKPSQNPGYKGIIQTKVEERLNKEVKRRTKVAGLFPNEASCERLVTAVVAEIHDEWAIAQKYLNHEEEEA